MGHLLVESKILSLLRLAMQEGVPAGVVGHTPKHKHAHGVHAWMVRAMVGSCFQLRNKIYPLASVLARVGGSKRSKKAREEAQPLTLRSNKQ